MGDILDIAIRDARRYLNGGFSNPLSIVPDVGEPFIINGLASVHSQGFDSDGIPIIAENSHICFAEKDVTDLGYTIRVNGKVKLQDWRVSFTLNSITYNCVMSEPEPDGTLGIIRVKLTNYG